MSQYQQLALLVWLAFLCLLGCHSTYSSPLRSASFGAPGRTSAAEIEAGLAGHISIHAHSRSGSEPRVRPGASPIFAVGVTNWLAFEASGEWSHERAMSGNGALRFTLEGDEGRHDRYNADLLLGGGGGRGGVLCDNRDYTGVYEGLGTGASEVDCPGDKPYDGRDWLKRPFYGGFVAAGLSWPSRRDMLAPFIHVNLQLTDGQGTPLTFWFHVLAGLQVSFDNGLRFFFGGGPSGYHNEYDALFNGSSFISALLDNNLAILIQIGLAGENKKSEKRSVDGTSHVLRLYSRNQSP